MINEWALAIQKKLRLADIMMLQHSFPTTDYSFKANILHKLCCRSMIEANTDAGR
jgi:hypothetical protein